MTESTTQNQQNPAPEEQARPGVLLIANRGEIARRVIRTARAEGWRTVALCTDLDAEAAHVREADTHVSVPSYLDIDAVVAAARASGATHVHPGYGFLSERAPFVRALAEAGVALVGPSADVMDSMGRKDHAREVALAAGVPVVPSYSLEDDPSTFAYPVLVKAAAGGGGKGMRVVASAAEFTEALDAARREAVKGFGDDTMLIEKFVTSGRHIEVQVVGDSHGVVRHFFERDCSTQRRHQKVLEEAPAPTLSPEQRDEITSAAVALAAQVGYVGAGTVEFLLDNATGEFYFLEMNTRLQVEHPVTEEAVRLRGERLDLVSLQLQVALGEPLGFEQEAVTLEGFAIEARVYAEDAFGGFLPQAGTATFVLWPDWVPVEGGEVRVDEALSTGQVVSTSYDPMLGKVIGIGTSREVARAALVEALGRVEIFGLTTNTGFLRTLAASDEFGEATIDTSWLDHHEVPAPADDWARDAAAAALLDDQQVAGVWQHDGWRSAGAPAPTRVHLDEWVTVDPSVQVHRAPLSTLPRGMADATRERGQYARVWVHGGSVEVTDRGQRFVFTLPDPFADGTAAAGDGTVVAPMPGTVLQVRVSEGQQVAAGDTMGVMEAMKMELPLTAPFDGTVTTVSATEGSQVPLGAALFVVEGQDQ